MWGPFVTDPSHAVFLSYASQDAEAAQRICDALRTAGIQVWFDQSELRGGDAWDRQIRKQIHDCALFMPLISAHSQARLEGYFRREWNLAAHRKHDMAAEKPFLVPVVIDGTPERGASVPEEFHELQWTRLPGGETPTAFVERVKRLLSPENIAAPDITYSAAGATASSAQGGILEPAAGKSLLPWIAIAAAVLILALGGGYFAWRDTQRTEGTQLVKTTGPPPPAADVIPEKSVAVLPFVDMSEKHDQEYFADGIAEEILDQLARIGDLRVIARTSSFSFKGKPDDIPTIGGKLKVATILEGSVRRSQSRVRVTTQLVRAATGEHIWSNSYEREFKDVIGIQVDIAASVAGALKATLLEHFNASTSGTTSAEAYDLYLKALALGRHDRRDSGSREVSELCRRALSIDPAYADAWVLLSSATGDLANNSPHREKLLGDAREFARRAIDARPDLAGGYLAYGSALIADLNVAAARVQFNRALSLNPNDQWAIAWAGLLARYDGRLDESIRLVQRSLDLDPENTARYFDLAIPLHAAGRYREAEAAYRRYGAAVVNPILILRLADLKLDAGDAAGALELVEGEKDSSLRRGCSCLTLALERLGRRREAQAAFRDLEANFSKTSALDLAEVYAQHGDADQSFRWLDAAVAERDFDMLDVRWNRKLASLRSDARFGLLLERLGLPPIRFDATTRASER